MKVLFPFVRLRILSYTAVSGIALTVSPAFAQQLDPLDDVDLSLGSTGRVLIQSDLPPGARHIVLESADNLQNWSPMVSSGLTGTGGAKVTFRIPKSSSSSFFRLRAGTDAAVPNATFMAPSPMLSVLYGDDGELLSDSDQVGHVLNRIAYGPSMSDFLRVNAMGAAEYIQEQLDPESVEETDPRLDRAVESLFVQSLPGTGNRIIEEGAACRYFRGTEEPPTDWIQPSFDDSGPEWLVGTTGLGYGDDDDATVLDDMQGNYLSFYVRIPFTVADPAAIEQLVLTMIYDDAFVAYLNGQEITRANITGNRPTFDQGADDAAGNVDEDLPSDFEVPGLVSMLVSGENLLAIQVHNANLGSSDASIIPELAEAVPFPYRAISSVEALQQLLHVRGIYSKRQLQAVLGEFWENHFTTEYDKIEDYLENIDEYEEAADVSEAAADLIEAQVRTEASRIEWQEYEFFYENALGNFGDLLLYSATSPAMLIYLDNVLNVRNAPNENYAREILELHSFGVDNGYTQADIEELSRCFTGWTVRKIATGSIKPFPQSARDPFISSEDAVSNEVPILDAGAGGATWRFFRGTVEPPANWATAGFNDSTWEQGVVGIGYDRNTPPPLLTTILDDMRGNYASVYIRREVDLSTISQGGEIALTIDFDDGYVAYLNGTEIGRSDSMVNNSTRPVFSDISIEQHEAGGEPDSIPLSQFQGLINASGPNVIAIQGHNSSLGSSDFSLSPRVISVTPSTDNIDITELDALWTFRFQPGEHDTDSKVLFEGTDYQIQIPADRTGASGVNDAIEVIDALVENENTAEFICIKLINRFVSDDISLESYEGRTAPLNLLTLADEAIAAWLSTSPAGNIEVVLRAILDPDAQGTGFWVDGVNFSKVKTPIEYINSSLRALDATVIGDNLPDRNSDMGMNLFQRADPDGFSEVSSDWADTLGFLERMRFCQNISSNNGNTSSSWDIDQVMADNGLGTPEDLIEFFNGLLFQGRLNDERKAVVLNFVNTDNDGDPSPFENITNANTRRNRLQSMVGLLLASPEFHFQ